MVTRRAGWTRRLAEALTITLGILAAFAIDAWWEEVRERREDAEHLTTVLRELGTTHSLLDDAIRLHRLSQDQAATLLELTASGDMTLPPDSVSRLTVGLFNSYIINAPTGALQAAIMSGAIARLEDEVNRPGFAGDLIG